MDPKKKNLILGLVAGALLVVAVLIGFRDSLFGASDKLPPEIQADVQKTQQEAEPPPPAPAKPVFSKKAQKIGG